MSREDWTIDDYARALDAAEAERDPSDAEVPVTNEERDRWRRIVESQRHDISDLAGQLERSSRDAAYHQTLAELAESERDEAVAKVAEGQEHIAYHLRDFRPRADMAATGDLAVDMVAYADRLKARAELAESERDEAVAKVARVSLLAVDLTSDDCELYDEPEWDCITAGPQVLAVDGCLPCRLRAALADPASDEGGAEADEHYDPDWLDPITRPRKDQR